MTPPNVRKERKEELKNLLIQVKEENEKAGLKLNTQKKKKLNTQKLRTWHLVPSLLGE